MKALIFILLFYPWKEYQVIDKDSQFLGTTIIAKRIQCGQHTLCFHRKYLTARKYNLKGEFDYLVFDKWQLSQTY